MVKMHSVGSTSRSYMDINTEKKGQSLENEQFQHHYVLNEKQYCNSMYSDISLER